MAAEVLFLLSSIISAIVSSIVCSLVLLSRFLLAHCLHFLLPQKQQGDDPALVLYKGKVWHRRMKPVHHAFEYEVRYALVDLDRPPVSLASSIRRHHMTSQDARKAAGTDGPVLLLTIPSSVGYEQNPLSVYYCYNGQGSLKSLKLKRCIIEVTNTPWGERVSFAFNPGTDLVSKPLHVSPFMDMLGNWNIHADPPGDDLFLRISVQHPILGNYFVATLQAKKEVGSVFWKRNLEIFFWLMPQKVAIWIYWQALKLWLKKVSFIQHPKYLNRNYREEALRRDRELMNCAESTLNEDTHHEVFVIKPGQICQANTGSRWCTWKDAQWPWS